MEVKNIAGRQIYTEILGRKFKPFNGAKKYSYSSKATDLSDALSLVETATEESLKEIQEDLDYFLKEEEEREAEEVSKKSEADVNPFAALIGIGQKKSKALKEKEKKKEKEISDLKDIKKDTYAESVIRKYAEKGAASNCYTIYDIYKKSHGMASAPPPGKM